MKNIYILNVRPGGTHNYRLLTCYGKYCCTTRPCGTAEHFGFLLTLSDTGFAAYKKFHVLSRWFAVGLTAICNGFRVLRHSERRNYVNALGMSTFSGSKEYQRRNYSQGYQHVQGTGWESSAAQGCAWDIAHIATLHFKL